MTIDASARADVAARAVRRRYLRALPGIAWGRSAWPPRTSAHPDVGGGARWHYWWSAHLLDAAVDAAERRPGAASVRFVRAVARGIWLRNGVSWSRGFWDDLAWMGLATERARGMWRPGAGLADRIAGQLTAAIEPTVGAVPWSVDSRLFNAPANGPAAVLLARTGRVEKARVLADWMHENLRDAASGLIRDGVVIDGTGRRDVDALYTYCQGVALGAAVELAAVGAGERFASRADDLVRAIAGWTAPSGALPGSGGGDGGLFAGITCRYLARAARLLPAGTDAADASRALVRANAEALWTGRVEIDDAPLFSADAHRAADAAPTASERDLSVQVGAWMTLEAAAAL